MEYNEFDNMRVAHYVSRVDVFYLYGFTLIFFYIKGFSRMSKFSLLVSLFLFLGSFTVQAATNCQIIISDTVWSGEVKVSEDVLVQKGAVLTILPGTRIIVSKSDSTKTEPEYLSSLTEITVRGVLKAIGSPDAPISFKSQSLGVSKDWAGIIVDGGQLDMAWGEISGAESAITAIAGEVSLKNSRLTGNRHGISVISAAVKVVLEKDIIELNDYGLALLNGAAISKVECKIRNNDHKNILQPESKLTPIVKKLYEAVKPERKTVYTNESLLSTVIWKDRVVVKGVVRVPAKGKLVIMPGTIVEFSKRDTNGDDIGENGLLIMGVLVAKGTPEKPIIFRSAEPDKKLGDWDAINIYSSDGAQNIIEYCQFENAYRALHFHFSNVSVSHSVLRNNYRALQFQESLIKLTYNDVYNNKSAIRGRDSEVNIFHNRIYNNYTGPNIFRVTGKVRQNRIVDNYLDGLRIREGSLEVEENFIAGNRFGLTIAYANFGKYSNNVVSQNLETGLTIKGTDSVAVGNNFIQGNGTNGISLLNSRAVIKGNQISDNGERGIGIVSFSGVLSANNLLDNKLYAIGLDGSDDVEAPGNFYGGVDLATAIYDKDDDPEKGRLNYKEVSKAAIPFVWPLEDIFSDTVWDGEIHLPRKVTLELGSTLKIDPGSKIKFARGTSLWLNGNFEAVGEAEKRISFSAIEDTEEQEYWNQITTEYAEARLENCDFRNANMAFHSHFSVVQIKGCSFKYSESGFRYRGGPVEIYDSLFEKNVFGMVAYFAKAEISGNTITKNDIGFLVRRERNGGLSIRHNNIFENKRYNMRMGDFNSAEDVDARENYWGVDAPGSMIFDEVSEPGIGLVNFEPPLTNPVP